MIVNRKGQRGISDYSRRGFLAGKGLIGMEGCVCHIMHLFEGACFLCSWASETDGLHDPAHAIPAVAGCSDCLLNDGHFCIGDYDHMTFCQDSLNLNTQCYQ